MRAVSRTGRSKIVSLNQLGEIIHQLHAENKMVALCHGCFDIVHVGHLRHFESARLQADALIVTITPDRFVNKGPDRPVFPELQRAELVAGFQEVNWVAINEWDSAEPTIRLLRPDVFVKGQEYELGGARSESQFCHGG